MSKAMYRNRFSILPRATETRDPFPALVMRWSVATFCAVFIAQFI